jgi:hypothetical protein
MNFLVKVRESRICLSRQKREESRREDSDQKVVKEKKEGYERTG